jgi:hypothetical protein
MLADNSKSLAADVFSDFLNLNEKIIFQVENIKIIPLSITHTTVIISKVSSLLE